MKRTILAFLIAPLIPVVVLIHDAGLLLALLYSYVLTYLFGIPLFFILKRKRKETHPYYALCGAISAAAVLGVPFLLSGFKEPKLLFIILVLAVTGAVEGLCFSLIRGRERQSA